MTVFETVGLSGLSLQVNSLGCPECRSAFREELKKYLAQQKEELCEDCRRRADTNPLRVFDCKADGCKEVVAGAPSILEFICGDCERHFKGVQDYLGLLGIAFTINPMLVRGLDYYTRTTFEIQTDRLGAQNAVLGGGRYDGLSKQLGGPDHPAIGFALGMERLITLLQEEGQEKNPVPDLFIIGLGEDAEKKAFTWASDLRKSGFWVETDYGSKGLKAQLRRADRLGASRVLIVGDNELASGKALLKDMIRKQQKSVDLEDLLNTLKNLLVMEAR
jgi:histidyl-tRNA synthetase